MHLVRLGAGVRVEAKPARQAKSSSKRQQMVSEEMVVSDLVAYAAYRCGGQELEKYLGQLLENRYAAKEYDDRAIAVLALARRGEEHAEDREAAGG